MPIKVSCVIVLSSIRNMEMEPTEKDYAEVVSAARFLSNYDGLDATTKSLKRKRKTCQNYARKFGLKLHTGDRTYSFWLYSEEVFGEAEVQCSVIDSDGKHLGMQKTKLKRTVQDELAPAFEDNVAMAIRLFDIGDAIRLFDIQELHVQIYVPTHFYQQRCLLSTKVKFADRSMPLTDNDAESEEDDSEDYEDEPHSESEQDDIKSDQRGF